MQDQNKDEKMNIEILAERVNKNKEIMDLRFSAFRNYAFLAVCILTVLGMASVYTIIENIVTKITENKLNQILTDEYVEEKIRTRSEKAINRLIKESEQRTLTIIDKYSTFNDWYERANEFTQGGRYAEGIKSWEKAAEKAKFTWPAEIREQNKFLALLGKTEAQLLNGNYDEALKTIQRAHQASNSAIYNVPILWMLDCITKQLLDLDTKTCKTKLTEVLETPGKKSIFWSYKEMEDWISTANISKEKKDKIITLIDFVKSGTSQ